MSRETIRIAAVGDIHCTRESHGALQPLFAEIADNADILLLCGDLVDYGLPEEAHVLCKEIQRALQRMPVLGVLGNHDYESGKVDEVRKILTDGGLRILEGDTYEFEGVGFVGVKGFGGGFGRRMLEPWGEEAIKSFVQHGIDETMKLETGLARLHTPQRIVMTHYAPIQATVEGEPLETHPFLGSSRLEEPINRYGATAVFHGHAHLGSPQGLTRENIPVYNVSMPLLKGLHPDQLPVHFMEIPANEPSESAHASVGNGRS